MEERILGDNTTKHVALFQLPSHSNGKVMISPCSLPNFLIVNRLFWQFSIQGCVTKLEISGNSLVLSHTLVCVLKVGKRNGNIFAQVTRKLTVIFLTERLSCESCFTWS